MATSCEKRKGREMQMSAVGIQAMWLSPEQCAVIKQHGRYDDLSASHNQFIASCAEDEICIPYGNELLKLPKELFGRMLAAAFRAAFIDAIERLNPRINSQPKLESFDSPIGQTFVSAVVKDEESDKRETGVGPMLDPRKAENFAQLQWTPLPQKAMH